MWETHARIFKFCSFNSPWQKERKKKAFDSLSANKELKKRTGGQKRTAASQLNTLTKQKKGRN
jgi:hypothetical protein